MDRETREMLRSSLLHVLTETSDLPLGARLADLGWDDVLAADAAGAHPLLFETRGRTLSDADALGPVLAGAVADARDAPELATATIVLPATLHPDRLSSGVVGARLTVDGVALSPPEAGAAVLVPVIGDGGTMRLAIADCGVAPSWSWTAVDGVDPAMGLVRGGGTADASAAVWFDGDKATAAWEAAITAGRWALGAELVGIGHHVLAAAVEYAGQRIQYGRPIGTFQAVQHRLASAYAALVGVSPVVAEAAATGSAWIALVAKALAGRAAEDACTQAQQIHGAIGFTWEHEFHRYLRRTYTLDRLLGDWRTLEFEIGTRVQTTGDVPRIGTL
jgi:hypothetical protein